MGFNPNLPNPGDKLSVSQGQLKSNNGVLNTSFGVNHFPFSDISGNSGKHNFVEFVERSAIPSPIVAGEETLYAKVIAGQGQLFMTRGSSGVEIQLTGPGVPITNLIGQTFLPGGIVMKWGTLIIPANSTSSYSYMPTLPNFPNNGFNVQLTGFKGGSGGDGVFLVPASISTSGFSIQNNSSSIFQVCYLAIGN
jgi:hypothetical protein